MARNGTQVLVFAAAALILRLVLCTSSVTGSVPTTFNSTVFLNISNDNVTVNSQKLTGNVLLSPSGAYEFVLIIASFGAHKPFYCWAEVQNSLSQTTFMWREPCSPPVANNCALNFTSDGNLLVQAGNSSTDLTTVFQTNTSGDGAVAVKLTDGGVLQLVKADNTTVWQSSDHLEQDPKCRAPFNISYSSSHRTRIGWFGLVSSITLSIVMALSLC